MNTTNLACATVLLLSTAVPCQREGASEAERLYREAWWLETGEGALDRALQTYLRAADAEGAGNSRARSLLRAASIQKRLSRTDEAIRTLEQLTRSYSGETEILAEARQRLTEWTASDLRNSFSTWYRRYLMSPEYQQKVVDLVHELGGLVVHSKEDRARRSEIENRLLTLGDAAIPALREAASSRNESLVERATKVLLQLHTLPPVQALLTHSDWAGSEEAWSAVLDLSERDRRAVIEATAQRNDPVGLALQAAARGPEHLIDLLASETGGEIASEEMDGMAYAAIVALHRLSDPRIQSALMALARREDAPLAVRHTVEEIVSEYGWRGATARDWLDWGAKAVTWSGRSASLHHAARLLRSSDGELLDELRRVFDDLNPELNDSAFMNIADGLRRNGLPLQLPWTEERIAEWLVLTCGRDGALGDVLGTLRVNPELIGLLARGVLRQPAELARRLNEKGGDLGEQIRRPASDEDQIYFETRWAREVLAVMRERWPQWSSAARIGCLDLLTNNLVNADWPSISVPIREYLLEQLSDERLDQSTRQRIKEMYDVE